MADPQPTDAHLRIAHTILEQIMVSDFSKRQISLLMFILRLSWGCGKKDATIPRQQDFELVGIGSGHIKVELDYLVESRVIYRIGNIFRFNKNYDQWRISRARGYHPDHLTEMVRLNLDNRYTSKEAPLEITESVIEDRTDITKMVRKDEESYHNGKTLTPKLATGKEKKEDRSSSISRSENYYYYTILSLYEEEIDKVTEMVKESVATTLQSYPGEWVIEAINVAVRAGKRFWGYVEGVLQNWEKVGHGEEDDTGSGLGGKTYILGMGEIGEVNPIAVKIWDKVLKELESRVSRSNFKTWFSKTAGYSLKDGVLLIVCPTEEVAKYLDTKQHSLVENMVLGQLAELASVRFYVLEKGEN